MIFHDYLISKSDSIIVLNSDSYFYYNKINLNTLKLNNIIDEPYYKNFFNEKRTLSLSKKNYNFTFLGSLSSNKGIYFLIDVFSQIEKKYNNYHLNIIGDSNSRDLIISYANKKINKKNISFYGHLQNPFQKLNESHFLIQPSFSEGISRSVIESLYFGVPVIIRKSVSYNLVKDGINGYNFEGKKDLIEIVENILVNDYQFTHNKILLFDEFRLKKVIKQYESIFLN